MKYSINWLKELSQTKLSTDDLVEKLTMQAFEVEREEFDIPETVVVGEILEIKKHPNADKLQIVKVNLGEKTQEIVCGASNIQVGQLVPVALLGTIMPNGMEIKKVEIRGIESAGMLCALDELGLGKDHSGIFILGKEAKAGEKLESYLEKNERSLEIKVLPDRAHDAFSHWGMAREIALLSKEKIDYDFDGLELPQKKSEELKIEIEDQKLCPRYIGIVWKGVKVKDSPEWIKEKLRDSGMRPINNIVDATNLVMLELGNPIHAFDREKIATAGELKIIIRKAKKNEELVLLDGEKKILGEDNLVIANQKEILALAGIKGGLNSGITENTNDLVIEIANFNAVSIRKTRTSLGLATDASLRYEKDIDPNLSEKSAVRIMEIISHIAGGELEGIVDKYSEKLESWEVDLEKKYVEALLGEKIDEVKIEKILDLLCIVFEKSDDGFWKCQIPTYRLDLKTQEDLIEDIGRIWGYEKIKSQNVRSDLRPVRLDPIQKLSRDLRRGMISLGFSEVYNHSFYGEKEIKALGIKESHFEIENPVSPEEKYFRASLIPNLLKNTVLNLNNFSDFSLFEIGKAYVEKDQKTQEKYLLSGILVREGKENQEEAFLELKGKIIVLAKKLLFSVDFKEIENNIIITNYNQELGKISILEKETQTNFGIKRFSGTILTFELDIQKILNVKKGNKFFKELPKFPKSPRDISFLASENKNVSFQEITEIIKKAGGNNLVEMELFDIFLREGRLSYSIHLEFMSEERTLEHKEVEEEMKKIENALEKSGLELRK